MQVVTLLDDGAGLRLGLAVQMLFAVAQQALNSVICKGNSMLELETSRKYSCKSGSSSAELSSNAGMLELGCANSPSVCAAYCSEATAEMSCYYFVRLGGQDHCLPHNVITDRKSGVKQLGVDRIKSLLIELLHELESTSSVDQETVALARKMEADIDDLINPQVDSSESTVLDDAIQLEASFAASHPVAEKIIRELINSLSKIGI